MDTQKYFLKHIKALENKINSGDGQTDRNFYKTITELSTNAILIIKNENIFYANPTALYLLGYNDLGELIGLHYSKIIHPDYIVQSKQRLSLLEKGNKNHPIIIRYYRKRENCELYAETVSIKITYNKKPAALIIARDISDEYKLKLKVKEKEHLLEQIENITHTGSYKINLNTGEAFWSKGVYAIFNYPLNQEIPDIEAYYSLVYKDDVELLKQKLTKCIQQEKPFNLKYRIVSVDHKLKWVHSQSDIVEDNNCKYLLGTFRDITKEKNDELKLSQSEKMFRTLFEQTGGYAMILDPNTTDEIPRIIDANKAAYNAHGYKKHEFIDRPVTEIYDEEGKKLVKNKTKQILTDGHLNVEHTHVRKDGSTFMAALKASRIDIKGELPLIFSVEYDISEHKEKEQKLIISEERFRILFDSVNDAIFFYDPMTYEITQANKATSILYGYSMDELIGMSCLKFSAEVDQSKLVNAKLIEKGTASVNVRHHKKKDGSDIFVNLSLYKASAYDQKIAFSVTKDITERLETEQILKESEYKYKNLVENSPYGIITFTLNNIVFANKAFLNMINFDPKKNIKNFNIHQFLVDLEVYRFDILLNDLAKIKKTESTTFNTAFKGTDGKITHAELILFESERKPEPLFKCIVHNTSKDEELKIIAKKLSTDAIYMSRKLVTFSDIRNTLNNIINQHHFDKSIFESLFIKMQNEWNLEQLWSVFQSNYERIDNNFFQRILKISPDLTQQELKHCAFIRLNFETKEIAAMFQVKPSSIQIARVRLKKKLNLKPNQDLIQFIQLLR